MKNRIYAAIDLKSFYASVECVERGLDAMHTNLVVADEKRTDKTICLAVSPSLKSYGISGRPRLFEVKQQVKEINYNRKRCSHDHLLKDESYDDRKLKSDSSLSLSFIIAEPRMALYMKYSSRIYQIYLKYVAPEDIHVYSIDEVFIDMSAYLQTYGLSAFELTRNIIQEVHEKTGITATAGIGPNLYLCKVAMDIVAKHSQPDESGVRIAQLDEMSYRHLLWSHQPLTDFWRVGHGISKKLEENGLMTMGDVARCSLTNENLLYQLFGVNAELLIDHAWGYEPCTIADIKAYKPHSNSLGTSQLLPHPYSYEKGKLIVKEMMDLLSLDLVNKGLVTNQISLYIGYDIQNLKDPMIKEIYHGPLKKDRYGREAPQSAHGSMNLENWTSSAFLMIKAVIELYGRIVNPNLMIRRVSITAQHITAESSLDQIKSCEQLDLFTDYDTIKQKEAEEENRRNNEKKIQKTMLMIKKKYGKNAILKGMNIEEGATARIRNNQIGGHQA